MSIALIGCEKPSDEPKTSADQAELRTAQPDPTISARVINEIGDILGKNPDTIKETDEFFRDLDIDDLDAVELVMGIEAAFEVAIPDEDAERIVTVGDLVRYVEAKIQIGQTEAEQNK